MGRILINYMDTGSSERKEGYGDGPVWVLPLSLSRSALNDVQRDFLMYTYVHIYV